MLPDTAPTWVRPNSRAGADPEASVASWQRKARPNGRAFFSRGCFRSGLWSQVQPVGVLVDHAAVDLGEEPVMDGARAGNDLAGYRARRVLDTHDDRNRREGGVGDGDFHLMVRSRAVDGEPSNRAAAGRAVHLRLALLNGEEVVSTLAGGNALGDIDRMRAGGNAEGAVVEQHTGGDVVNQTVLHSIQLLIERYEIPRREVAA